MEIVGLGNDIIEVERIQKAIEKSNRFKKRVFTKKEMEYAEKSKIKYNTYAGRFAAKEAVSKAFGTGIRGFNLVDIEIVNDELGKPCVELKNGLKEKYEGYNLMVTISHDNKNAMATAILIRENELTNTSQ